MYITVMLIALSAAILVFFSQEFSQMFRAIFAIPGVKLLLPLFLVSWLVEDHEAWGLWFLLRIKDMLHAAFYFLSGIFPGKPTVMLRLLHVMYLFVLAGAPLWLSYIWAKNKQLNQDELWPASHQFGMVLWIIFAILLTLYRP